jgi:hypothetical protein
VCHGPATSDTRQTTLLDPDASAELIVDSLAESFTTDPDGPPGMDLRFGIAGADPSTGCQSQTDRSSAAFPRDRPEQAITSQ